MDNASKFFEREFVRLAQGNDLSVAGGNFCGDFRNSPDEVTRNGLHAVDVAVQKVAGVDAKACDLNRVTKINDVNISVGNCEIARENWKFQFLQNRNIADGAIGHRAHAAQRAQNVSMHRPQQ